MLVPWINILMALAGSEIPWSLGPNEQLMNVKSSRVKSSKSSLKSRKATVLCVPHWMNLILKEALFLIHSLWSLGFTCLQVGSLIDSVVTAALRHSCTFFDWKNMVATCNSLHMHLPKSLKPLTSRPHGFIQVLLTTVSQFFLVALMISMPFKDSHQSLIACQHLPPDSHTIFMKAPRDSLKLHF